MSLVIFEDLSEAQALPLFVLRQNIYTDPQVPIQVKPGLYPVNGAKEDSPILFTTNFSLTYFTVLADIEKSKVPAWLLVVDSEGLSVMTAFSAGKLTPRSWSRRSKHPVPERRARPDILVMPGMVSRMSGKLQERHRPEGHRRAQGILRPAEVPEEPGLAISNGKSCIGAALKGPI